MSAQTLKVLVALLEARCDELSGVEIGKSAKLQSGTLYPILMRLEQQGWLASRWETEGPHALGRPRRRFYHLTGLGQTRAKTVFQELHPLLGRLSWA
jgi:PadR family transcriptional regulator, regulatory protein PadR